MSEIEKLLEIQGKVQNVLNDDYCMIPFDINYIINKNIVNNNTGDKILNRKESWKIIDSFNKNLINEVYPNTPLTNKKIYDKRLTFSKYVIYQDLNSKKVVDELKMTKNCLMSILKEIRNNIIRAILPPGENVGVTSGIATGSKNTQLNLDTFHTAGVESRVTGNMKRLKKVLSTSRTSKDDFDVYNIIFLKEKYGSSLEYAKKVLGNLNKLKIKNIIDSLQIINDPLIAEGKTIIKKDVKHIEYIYKVKKIKKKIPSFQIRLVFNLKKLYDSKSNVIYIEKDIRSIRFKKQNIYTIRVSKNVLRVFLDSATDNIIEKLNELSDIILNLQISGISGINGAIMTTNPVKRVVFDKGGNKKMIKEYVISTNGVNLKEILKIKYIDKKRTTSNDINEIFTIFGIETTRNLIFNELITIYYDNGITDILLHHISTMADAITHTGILTGENWSGMRKNKTIEPLQKISHERLSEFIINSSITGSIDNINSPTSGIFTGRSGNYGTNISDVLI
jgi:DNA-directed RNA polymerase beta' subunit